MLLLFLAFPSACPGWGAGTAHMLSCVSVPACGSAHTCNRRVISASRPRRRCQHARSAASPDDGGSFFLNQEPPDDPPPLHPNDVLCRRFPAAERNAQTSLVVEYAEVWIASCVNGWVPGSYCTNRNPGIQNDFEFVHKSLNRIKKRGKIYCECIAAKQCSLFQYSKKSCFHVLNSSVGAFHTQSWLLI